MDLLETKEQLEESLAALGSIHNIYVIDIYINSDLYRNPSKKSKLS